jgi:hypothetical protein
VEGTAAAGLTGGSFIVTFSTKVRLRGVNWFSLC